MTKIVIVSDGLFPQSEYCLSHIDNADIIVCCDGAAEKLLNHGYMPTYIVGDMDSLSEELKMRFREIIFADHCQETNDLTKAVRFAKELIDRNNLITDTLYILGATGYREDHTIGNISLLPSLNKTITSTDVVILTDWGEFKALTDSCTINVKNGCNLSIFSFDNTLTIKSSGLEYPTDEVIFDYWWKATLNRATSDRVTFTFSHPAEVVVFITR